MVNSNTFLACAGQAIPVIFGMVQTVRHLLVGVVRSGEGCSDKRRLCYLTREWC